MRQKLRQMQQQQNQATAAGPLTTGQRDGLIGPIPLAAVQIWKGAAAAVVLGTGLGTPLLPANPTHQFIGVWCESYNNTAGTGIAGSTGYYTKIQRQGCCSFGQTGTTITNAYINYRVYFADDSTVTLTDGTTFAGTVAWVDLSGNVWVDISQAVRTPSDSGAEWNAIAASGAINPHDEASYVITKAGVAALTLAAPTAGIDDGKQITLTSATLYAHTLTATGLLSTGTAAVNLATFAAYAGAGLTLKAYNGLWQVIASVGITFT